MKNIRYVGLDVHAETIAVAVAEPGGEIRDLGIIPNRPEAVLGSWPLSSAPQCSYVPAMKPDPLATGCTGS